MGVKSESIEVGCNVLAQELIISLLKEHRLPIMHEVVKSEPLFPSLPCTVYYASSAKGCVAHSLRYSSNYTSRVVFFEVNCLLLLVSSSLADGVA